MRRRAPREAQKYFIGCGIDIGAGPDCIDQLGFKCRNWDLKDGDAQFLAGVANGTYDYVHSSHCLEHMVDPRIALGNWIRVCKVGGYLVITIPDEELYEHELWPSHFNADHKWSFRVFSGKGGLPKHMNVFDLLGRFYKEVEIVKIERIEDRFRWDAPREMDQTLPNDGPECAIEIVLRKKR